ncbi:hypothetical protein MYCTH_2306613, partial [Thermothelomyces thermophilus ATCC 42464]
MFIHPGKLAAPPRLRRVVAYQWAHSAHRVLGAAEHLPEASGSSRSLDGSPPGNYHEASKGKLPAPPPGAVPIPPAHHEKGSFGRRAETLSGGTCHVRCRLYSRMLTSSYYNWKSHPV